MPVCSGCDAMVNDGVKCTSCGKFYDFPCAGITEAGYRKLGDRKLTWRCVSCKHLRPASPACPSQSSGDVKSPQPANLESIMSELRSLSLQMAVLPKLVEDIKIIKGDVMDLKTAVEFSQTSIEALSDRLSCLENRIQAVEETKLDTSKLQQRIETLEQTMSEHEQRSRFNNIEVKGVPITKNENLLDIISNIGKVIQCDISKEQINYVARVPMRNNKENKTIVASFNNGYLKENFIAAARTKKSLVPQDLGLQGNMKIFVNDHLTIQNKLLLNKAKVLARDRGFQFVWVKGCKIFLRRNPTSPIHLIKSEKDLNALVSR